MFYSRFRAISLAFIDPLRASFTLEMLAPRGRHELRLLGSYLCFSLVACSGAEEGVSGTGGTNFGGTMNSGGVGTGGAGAGGIFASGGMNNTGGAMSSGGADSPPWICEPGKYWLAPCSGSLLPGAGGQPPASPSCRPIPEQCTDDLSCECICGGWIFCDPEAGALDCGCA